MAANGLDRKIILTFLFVAELVIVAVILFRVADTSFDINAVPTVLLALALLPAMLYLKKGRSPKYAALVLIIGELVVVPHRSISTGYLDAGAIYWLLPSFALSAFILKGIASWIVFCIAVLEIFIIGFLGSNDADYRNWATHAFIIAGAQSLAFFGFRLVRSAYEIELKRVELLYFNLEKAKDQIAMERDNLAEANIKAYKANLAKADFLAHMSHDLRTPLHHILGFAQMLMSGKAGEVPKEQKNYLGEIIDSSNNLLIMINNILDLSKIEAGKAQLQREVFDLCDLVKFCIRKAEALGNGSKIECLFHTHKVLLEADRQMMQQIITNLLTNAIKYGRDEVIQISADILERATLKDAMIIRQCNISPFTYRPILKSRATHLLLLRIEDKGIGIPPENLKTIFQSFEQGNLQNHEQFGGGTGLGLSVTRNMLKMHNAIIWAESEGFDKGSTFKILIPMAG